MDDHYRRNHHRKPHEYLVNSPNPLSQQKPYEKNETAYIFLYIALAVGALFLAAMAYGVYRDHKSKSRTRKEEKGEKKRRLTKKNIFPDVKPLHGGGSSSGKSRSSSNNLYTTGTTSTGGSVPSMSTITEEVQPPSQDIPTYPNLASYTTTPVNQQSSHQQPRPRPPPPSSRRHNPPPTSTSSASYPDLTSDHHQQNSATESSNNLDTSGFQYFPNPATAPAPPPASNNAPPPPLPTTPPPTSSTRRQSRHLSREESFPYEKYDIPLDQREPRTTRVENMRPISDFFKLTAGESFYRVEEEDEEGQQQGEETSSESSSSTSRSESEEQGQEQSQGGRGGGGEERFSDAATLPYDHASKKGNGENGKDLK
ncbi:nucleoporin NUP159 [Folsomia candida]|uniref:Uncharacterized protein n=1 Tax=Folsomia candida TaxID=158441 RepID=A0A226D1Z1_FOLCA|nr:nucleoporin NUP159 [Folsomia candida]OXA39229.1 hypothetical protein Fcan01_26047 [Folsomia candida]